ncbi:MAG: hypothetical protein HY811_11925 [Planctomycetes bacterium]|nr:hypothetical protein [Planctomycetota bacterium]
MSKIKVITLLLVSAIALFSLNANKGCWGQKIIDFEDAEVIMTGSSGSGGGGSGGGGTVASGWAISAYLNAGDTGNATDVTSDSTYLYITGWYLASGGTATVWRIEKREKTTGALVINFGSSGALTSTGNAAAIASPMDIVADADYLYIAGYDTSSGAAVSAEWRVEKRTKDTGILVSSFGTNGVVVNNISAASDIAYAIAVDDNFIYIAGQASGTSWRIEKRSKITGALDTTTGFGTGGVIAGTTGSPSCMILEGSYLYIGGYDNVGGGRWRLEKRSSTTGSTVGGFFVGGVITEDISVGADSINKVISDGGFLYIGGYDNTGGNNQWRAEKRDTLGGSFDATFGPTGIMTNNPSSSDDTMFALTSDTTYIYAVGSDTAAGRWRIEKRYKTNGVLESSFGSDGLVAENFSSASDEAFDVLSDDNFIYIVGYDTTGTGSGATTVQQWRIEKRFKSSGSF